MGRWITSVAQVRHWDFSAYRDCLKPWDWAGRITYGEFVGGEQKASEFKVHQAAMFREGLEEKLKRVAVKIGGKSDKCGAIGTKRRFPTQ